VTRKLCPVSLYVFVRRFNRYGGTGIDEGTDGGGGRVVFTKIVIKFLVSNTYLSILTSVCLRRVIMKERWRSQAAVDLNGR
jgi:hypothetical protein